ncbi:type VI secretion system baseplate subunit TssK [Sinorhizobium medicae]
MPDGTPFSIPEDADQPTPYEVPGNLRDSLIHLAVPLYQPGGGGNGCADKNRRRYPL